MAFFSNFFNFFKPPKKPKQKTVTVKATKTSPPTIKQKPKAITLPKAKPISNLISSVKKAFSKQQMENQYIPKTSKVESIPEPTKTPEEKAEIVVYDFLAQIDKKVQVAIHQYTNKDGTQAKAKYQDDAPMHDMLEYQLQEIHTYIMEAVDAHGFKYAKTLLDRVNLDDFDHTLYYYPTALLALPNVLAQITQAVTPLDATSVFDSSSQTDYENDESDF